MTYYIVLPHPTKRGWTFVNTQAQPLSRWDWDHRAVHPTALDVMLWLRGRSHSPQDIVWLMKGTEHAESEMVAERVAV